MKEELFVCERESVCLGMCVCVWSLCASAYPAGDKIIPNSEMVHKGSCLNNRARAYLITGLHPWRFCTVGEQHGACQGKAAAVE